jgi:CheY-like chemotaxis protein
MVALTDNSHKHVNFCDLTLLIVDDNQYMRQLIGHMLPAFEVGKVLAVTSANEAFDEIRQTHIDCVIVDWLMPGGMIGSAYAGMPTCGWKKMAGDTMRSKEQNGRT